MCDKTNVWNVLFNETSFLRYILSNFIKQDLKVYIYIFTFSNCKRNDTVVAHLFWFILKFCLEVGPSKKFFYFQNLASKQ